MKIAYFVNSFNAINWGGQATSNGIKYMLNIEYPNAEFVPLNLPKFPFNKIKILRKYYEWKLKNAILKDDKDTVIKMLKKMNIKENIFDEFTHICFNGEGAIHTKSGHLIRLMGMLYLAKIKGKIIASINQSIDLQDNHNLEVLVAKVYNLCDFVSAREIVSFEYAKSIGIEKVQLIPDAAYGIPRLSQEEIDTRVDKYNLPKNFISVTGSSFLKKDKKSILRVARIIDILKEMLNEPIVFLANAKTDIWIAHKLKNKYNYQIIEPPVKYQDAMAIISKSKLVVGGRQHPNIFAYEYNTPYVPFGANTIKNLGVGRLQKYPLEPIGWDSPKEQIKDAIGTILNSKIEFGNVVINNFKIFG
jgi:hypothetical protein